MLDLAEQRFGRLLVVRATGTTHRSFREWECLCDCGAVCIKTTNALRTQNTKSCGCLRTNPANKKKPRLPPCQAAKNLYRSQYVSNAKSRGLNWELTDDQVQELSQCNCHYCGAKPSRTMTAPRSNGSVIVNGIDRLDSTIGYTPDNCVAACAMCNRSKMDLSVSEFQDWMERAASHNNMQFNG